VGLFFLAVAAAVAAFTLLSPRAYRSQAKLLVRLGRENATLDPTATFGMAPVVAVPPSRDTELNTAAEILKSRALLEKVVDTVGPPAILDGRVTPPAPEASRSQAPDGERERYRALVKLTQLLDVEPVKKSNILAVSYDGPSPELAQTVVSKLLDFYLDRHMQLSRTPGAHQFLAEQTARQRDQLTRAEEELRDLKNETGLIAPDGQRQLLVSRMGRLEDDLLQTRSALAAAEAEARLLREKLVGLSPTQVSARTKGIRNEAADNMRGQLFTLQLRELELRKHPQGHPDLLRVRQQVDWAQDILRKEESEREQVTEGPNRIYEEVQLTLLKQEPVLAALRVKADTLREQLDRQRHDFQAFNENSLRVARLERGLALQESHYRRYAENLEQAQIDQSLEAGRLSNISIVQPATYDPNPVRPRLLVTLGLGLLVAVFGGVGLALAAERLDRSVKTPEDVEKQLALPLLASVPCLSFPSASLGKRDPLAAKGKEALS
jgi:tyrosine-protein kinase Etk/Wzc